MRRDGSVSPAQGDRNIRMQGIQYERNPEASFGDHIKNTGAICNTSASHTYGNVMSVIEKYLLDTFPPGMFKSVTASTTLASRQITHTPRQLYKKECPLMVLVPRIVFGQDENRFLGHTLINDRITNTHAIWGDGSLLELASDPRKRLYVHGHYNRAVMYVDVVMSFNTYSEQINMRSYLQNMFPIGHNHFIRAPLELYIPGEFCNLMGKLAKVPVQKDESVHDFLTYMNGIWYYPITYKLKGGSNTNEFFMYYLTDIDVVIQDPAEGQGVKDGQIRRNFDVSFTVRCEFNTIGYFTLNHPEIKYCTNISPVDDPTIVPIFTDSINLNDFHLPIGWKILTWPIFKLKYGENSISLEPILNESLKATIDYHLKAGIPMNRFIQIQFRENGEIMEQEAFHIDWKERKLILAHPNCRRTYRLLVTVSDAYVNQLVKQLYHLE